MVPPFPSYSTISLFSVKVKELDPLCAFFDFPSVLRQDGEVHYTAISRFMLIISWCSFPKAIKWQFWILKSQINLCVSFSRADSSFCMKNLPFDRIVEFQIIAQLPVNKLSQQAIPNLVRFLFTSLLHSLVLWLTVLFFLSIIYICYSVAFNQISLDIIGPNGVIFCCYDKTFSFSLEVWLSEICSSFIVSNFFSLSLEISIRSLFFPFLFRHFSVWSYFADAVTGCHDESFVALFDIIFMFFIDVSNQSTRLTKPLSTSFFDTCRL